MRVVTTAPKSATQDGGYALRWLDSRKNWPDGTEFWFYTEGYDLPETEGLVVKDFRDIEDFSKWKLERAGFSPPGWQWDVVRYSHKVFAACDALYDYNDIGVWLDADCVTYKPVTEELIRSQLNDKYLAHYGRTGMYTETGIWIMDCSHEGHKEFLDKWRSCYFDGLYKRMPQWHDCYTLDYTIRALNQPTHNLSGEYHKDMHPQAKTELGKYIDHCKGPRKGKGFSKENKFRKAHL